MAIGAAVAGLAAAMALWSCQPPRVVEVPEDADSIATMKTRGLTVTTIDPKTAASFRAEADAFVKTMRGQMVPADVYDAAIRERDAFRKTQK